MAEVDIVDRESKYLPEERAIARACVDLLRPGDAVFLDGGSTAYEVARLLAEDSMSAPPGRQPIKILTNSFRVAEICNAMQPGPPVVLGGRYRPSGGCFVGPVTITALQQFRVDVAFIGVTGITESGFAVADVA
jgi:DeoR/GlpR family transcriptional regulator of sugar metabolism